MASFTGVQFIQTIDHLNLKLLMFLSLFIGIEQVLRFDFQKFRILEILNFYPCVTAFIVEFIYMYLLYYTTVSQYSFYLIGCDTLC